MVAKRRSFTREFKVEIAQMLTTTDVSVTEAAADLGIQSRGTYGSPRIRQACRPRASYVVATGWPV